MSTPSPSIRARGAIKAAGGLLGTKQVGERCEVLPTNVRKIAGLEPVGYIGGGPPAPVYLGCEVDEAAERLAVARARRAATLQGTRSRRGEDDG